MGRNRSDAHNLYALCVGDPLANSQLILQDSSFLITFLNVDTTQQALKALDSKKIDVILLSLPNTEAMTAISFFRRYASTYALVVMATEDTEHLAFRAVQAGAQDYLLAGCFDARLFRKIIRNAIERQYRARRLTILAHYDELTKLPNRAQFIEHLSMATARAARRHATVSLLFIDLDGFKEINDTYGHSIGDDYLRSIAERLQTAVRASDFLSRLGGDEFTVIVEGLEEGVIEPLAVAQKILAIMDTPIKLPSGEVFSASCSIGVASLDGSIDSPNIAKLMGRADSAMYCAKQRGGKQFHFYDKAMEREAGQRVYLNKALARAVDRQEFSLFYQPVYGRDSYRPVGFDALLRWNDPETGVLEPDQFIQVLEEGKLIHSVGKWILGSACKQFQAWRVKHYVSDDCWVSVNVSSKQLFEGEIIPQVEAALNDSGLPPACLQLEFSERLLMNESSSLKSTLQNLKAMGVVITLDNFGASHGSLQQLNTMPVDVLKIDRSFIGRYLDSSSDKGMTTAIVQLAHSLNKRVVAEGVENQLVAEEMVKIGCDYCQGYYFARPLPADECIAACLEASSLSHSENHSSQTNYLI